MMEVGEEALDLLTNVEVARRLRLSKSTVNRLIYAEMEKPGTGIKSVKCGRSRRIPPEAVAAYKQRLMGISDDPAA